MMSSSITEGRWKQIKGKVKERWGDVTDDEYKESEGKTDQLAGKIQEKYGHAKEDVHRHLNDLLDQDDDDTRRS